MFCKQRLSLYLIPQGQRGECRAFAEGVPFGMSIEGERKESGCAWDTKLIHRRNRKEDLVAMRRTGIWGRDWGGWHRNVGAVLRI